MQTIVSSLIVMLFILFFFSHALYFVVGLFTKKVHFVESTKQMSFDYLIVAKNEEKVIEDLIDSLLAQQYPSSLRRIFVLADNCSDQTYEKAKAKGVIVFKHQEPHTLGKGKAISLILEKRKAYGDKLSDAVIFFDADNVVDPLYTYHINNAMQQGHQITIGYRNTKNFGYNFFATGTTLVFLREAHFLHPSRNALGQSTHINGTGFAVLSSILDETPWSSYSLIEDVEFTIHQLIKNRKVTYVPDAMFYDEQPTSWTVSYKQRMRWIKGAIQNFYLHTPRMLTSLKKTWSSSLFDIWFWIIPFPSLLTLLSLFGVIYAQIEVLMESTSITFLSFMPLYSFLFNFFMFAFVIGFVSMLAGWRYVKATVLQKLVAMITFPFYSLTFLPILASALFTMHRLDWYKTPHHITNKEPS